MVNAYSTAVPEPMIAVVHSILRFAILDLVVILVALHPLQCFNGLDMCVPLETKCPNPAANSQVLHPGLQETHMLRTCKSLLTPTDQRKHKLSTPALKVATPHSAYSQLVPKLTMNVLLHGTSANAPSSGRNVHLIPGPAHAQYVPNAHSGVLGMQQQQGPRTAKCNHNFG